MIIIIIIIIIMIIIIMINCIYRDTLRLRKKLLFVFVGKERF